MRNWRSSSRVFRKPTLLNSIDLQCGQRVVNSDVMASLIGSVPPSRGWVWQRGRCREIVWNRVGGDRRGDQSRCDSPPAPLRSAPGFAGQAPIARPVLSRALPVACAASTACWSFVALCGCVSLRSSGPPPRNAPATPPDGYALRRWAPRYLPSWRHPSTGGTPRQCPGTTLAPEPLCRLREMQDQ